MMNRLGKLLTGGVALLTVGAVATVWATSSTAADARFVTATAATGDVTQTYLATGSISRDNNVTATFTVDGTVRKVHVAIGDEVQAGDLLARLNTAELKLALLNAETDLAQAKASLYEARHPASSSSGSSSGSGSSGGLPSGGGSTPGGSTGGISAADAATLYEAIAAVNAASANWSSADADNPTTCDLAYAALLAAQDDSGETGDTGTAAGGSGGSGSGDSGSGDSGSGDSGSGDSGSGDSGSGDSGAGDPASGDSGSGDSGSGDSGSGDSGSGDSGSADSGSGDADDSDAAQFSLTVDEITVEDIQACGEARTALLLANARLADYYNQLVTTGTIGDKDGDGVPDQPANGGSGSGSSSSSSSSSSKKKSSSSSSSTSTSARAIASAKADVLEAQQAVDAAELDVANAELVAPIDGTVGAMTLAKGDSASSASVTIVGEGTATVSIEVTPAGSSEVLEGKVSTISTLETDGISGDSPTYTTTVVVSDPDQRLKAGAKASVAIVTGTATGVITVPASAVTPTAAGKGTVQVVDTEASDTASTVEVTTGTVGGGRVEIASGVEVGQLVVLSDRTIDISTLTSSSSSSNRFGGGGMMR
jgi:HlyD family secretion protein